MRDKVTRQCPQTATTEEKGEAKRIRTVGPLLTSFTARPDRLTLTAILTVSVEVGWWSVALVHRNRRLIRDGAQDVHLDFHTAPEL